MRIDRRTFCLYLCVQPHNKMKKLIFIDACMRAGSRTRRIARPIIEELRKRYSVETVDLTKNIYPVADNYTLEDRNQGIVPAEHVAIAKKIAAADRIVIAAPFWDMSFPSALKVFFEKIGRASCRERV